MKCLVDKFNDREHYIRMNDETARRLVSRPNGRFKYVPKWEYKLYKDMEYRGKRL